MTQWKDTPASQGFLPVAIADAKVAATHAGYMQKSPDNLDSLKLHAGHVINALDPSIEMKGPGSGYGVKRAAAGASQHVQLAAKTEGASKGVQTHAGHVTASLANVTQWTDAAIATAQKIRAATSASEAAPLVAELIAQTNNISNGVDANKDGSYRLADRRRRPRAGESAHDADDEGRRALRIGRLEDWQIRDWAAGLSSAALGNRRGVWLG